MLGKLLKFEISYHTRQISFWVTLAIMLILGFLVMSLENFSVGAEGSERIKANGSVILAAQAISYSLASIFFAGVFVVTGMLRDQNHKFLEIIHATPILTRDMTLSRMIGAFLATFLCASIVMLGAFIGQFMPWVDAATMGPVNLLYFLYPTILFLFINCLIFTSLFIAVAAVTGKRNMVYVSAIAIFALYLLVGILQGSDAPPLLAALTDPLGGAALAEVTEFWPPEEQNNRLIPITGYLALNRIFWLGIALSALLSVFRFFKRGSVSRKTKLVHDEDSLAPEHATLKPIRPKLSLAHSFKTFGSRFKFEYLTTVRSISFIILMTLAFVLTGIIIAGTLYLDSNPPLATSQQISLLSFIGFALPMLIIIIFFSGEMVWRDRQAGLSDIIDATPVHNAAVAMAKWVAMAAVVYTIIAVSLLAGMIVQTFIGDAPVNIMTYAKFGFISIGISTLFSIAMALFVQNFAPHKVLGMFAAAGILVGLGFVRQIPFYHPIMDYGTVGFGPLSEINGFRDASVLNGLWNLLYWGSLIALFAIFTIWIWRRGQQTQILSRFRGMKRHMTTATLGLAVLFGLGFIGTGLTLYKAYGDADYRNRKTNEKYLVAQEKLMEPKRIENLPKIRSVEADVQLMPSRKEAVISGRYIVENTTGEALTEIYITPPSRNKDNVKTLNIKGATRVTQGDNLKEIEEYGYYLYAFDTPLAPNATTEIDFETFFPAPKLRIGSPIIRNGTFINNFATMPQIGVRDTRMRNPDVRRRYDLPEINGRAERTNQEARQRNFISGTSDYVDFKARICTDKGQIPIAPGKLIRSYEDAGRACRDYQAINPILNFFSFLSADYAVREDIWENPNGDNVDLAIYYHPEHDYNVEIMIDAMKSSLDTFTTTFGPYQYAQVRIMEFPYASFAQAFAGTIPFSEGIGFEQNSGNPEDDDHVDLATYVTMHEIGHQWFAHQIVPADTKGFNVLSEGLTENASVTAYEDKFGWAKTRRLLQTRTIESYLRARTLDRDDEPSLAKAGNQQYLVYNKASWVFWGLKQYMGEAEMQGAIRAFLNEFGSKGPPYPTTKELIDYLREYAGEEYQQLITDYWERNTFWELKLSDDPKIETLSGERVKISLDIEVDKLVASEESGKETSVTEIEDETLGEWVEIGFYDKDPSDDLGAGWTHLERIFVEDKDSTVSFELSSAPTHVLLDPRRLLIERNVTDNMKTVENTIQLASEN